jgi:hypothetical protein
MYNILNRLENWLKNSPGHIREAELHYTLQGYACRLQYRDAQPEFISEIKFVSVSMYQPDLNSAIHEALYDAERKGHKAAAKEQRNA